jgi:Zn-dependent peptidase ImmA (M78 family)/transcriptional regulator with XRE-family HTH domain
MAARESLGNSQFLSCDGYVDEEIGARMRARVQEFSPKLTQRELATKIEMTPDALSRALSGKRAFTAIELVKAAELLGTSAHWFVTGDPDPFAVKVAGRHTFDHDTKRHQPLDWAATQGAIANVALAYTQVFPAATNPTRTKVPASPVPARAALRDSVGASFIRELSTATKRAFDVDVVRVGNVGHGLAIDVVGHRSIVVSEIANWFRENWSMAHELGHINRNDLSEAGTNACDNPAAERAANAYAAELLMPEADLRKMAWRSTTLSELADYVWSVGVSTDALARRLSKLKEQLSEDVKAGLAMSTQLLVRAHASFAIDAVDLISQRMKEAAARRLPDRLIAAHIEAVSDGKLGASTLAWMLGAPVEEIEEQLSPTVESAADIDKLAKQLRLVLPPS